jgi:hypothetical protein
MIYAFAFIAFIIVVLLVVLAVGLIAALIRAIAFFAITVAAALVFGVLTALIVSLLTAGTANISGLGAVSGIIIFIATIIAIINKRHPQRPVLEQQSSTVTIKPADVAEIQNSAPSKKRGKAHDLAVAKALATLKAGATGCSVQLESIEERYQALLALADRFPEDSEADDIARKIRRGVSDYIKMFGHETELATDPERHASLATLMNTLETIATEAERHRARLQAESDNRLKMHAEFLKHGIEPKPFSTLD